MTKDEADRFKALVKERRFKGEITKAELDEQLAEIEADYRAANPQPQKPRMKPGCDGSSIETWVGGDDPEAVDGGDPFDAQAEAVFGLEAQFELISEVGTGGFGKVYKARHKLLGLMRAIKRLKPRPGQTPEEAAEVRSRFLLEARAMMALEHPGIVRLYDCSEDQYGPYLIMESYPAERWKTV